jgi:hypothetical protein
MKLNTHLETYTVNITFGQVYIPTRMVHASDIGTSVQSCKHTDFIRCNYLSGLYQLLSLTSAIVANNHDITTDDVNDIGSANIEDENAITLLKANAEREVLKNELAAKRSSLDKGIELRRREIKLQEESGRTSSKRSRSIRPPRKRRRASTKQPSQLRRRRLRI